MGPRTVKLPKKRPHFFRFEDEKKVMKKREKKEKKKRKKKRKKTEKSGKMKEERPQITRSYGS